MTEGAVIAFTIMGAGSPKGGRPLRRCWDAVAMGEEPAGVEELRVR